MKNAKKFLALLLTLVMALALAVPAFATTLTINEPSDSYKNATYAGYKILHSTNNADNTKLFAYTLNDKYTAVLQNVTGKTTEADIIAYIAALKNDANGMRTFANDVYAAIKAANIAADKTDLKTGDNTVDEGYWLIAQTSDASDTETESLVIVDTVGKETVEITSKKDTFTVEKTVTDESQLTCGKDGVEGHTHTAACYYWSKTNESPVGATVKYQIATKVPSNMAGYKYNAYFIVGDILGQGLTLDKNSIEVCIDGTKADTTAYTIRYSDGIPACESGYTFQVALVDPKTNAGKDVVVYYSAMVNEYAELTLTGNPNEADVTYNPTDDSKYGGEPGDSEGGFPKDTTIKVDGKTPKSYTITYATGVKFLKVDGTTKQPLNGAEFTVTGTTETTELKWVQEYIKVADGETGTYYKLKDGSYTTQAPIMADKMEAQTKGATFEGGYVIAGENDEVAVTIGNVNYRVATQDDFDKDTTIYTLVKANASKYAETTANYTYSEGWKSQTATKAYNTKVSVDENGIVNLPGLAAGTYTVSETKVPAGYNKIEDFDIVVTWTAPTETELAKGEKAQCTWTVEVGGKTLTLDETDTYLYKLVVENFSGTELPSTGGIGTTIFYALGGVLVAGAAILLITKKRMSNEA